jgi:2,5-furandicarboxylate decarboxylase 1
VRKLKSLLQVAKHMSWESLRDWVTNLESHNDAVTVDEPVSTKYEVAAYIKKSCNEGGPMFRFTNVEGHSMDILGGVYGTKSRILEALDVDSHQAGVKKYLEAIENPIEPTVVQDGPVCEVIETDPDLNEIPIVHHNEYDEGHYVTAGIQVANLPHTGVRGQGIYRMPKIDNETLGLYSPEERRVGYAYRQNADRGETTELAIVLGADPSVTMGSIANVAHSQDKYGIGGAFKGKSIELVSCKTVDIEVPANAELILEGIIKPEQEYDEGWFGEYPGCYSHSDTIPKVEITGIMKREDAMYHTILTGFPPTENNYMNWIGESSTVKQDAERAVPAIDQATVKCGTYGGNGRYEAIVSVNKRLDGEPWNIISSVLGGRTGAKYCTVVDADVDIYDEKQVNWAMNTRVQPDRDVHTFPTMVGASLDPSGPSRQAQKMGIDATIPNNEDSEEYQRAEVPGTEDVSW